MCVCVCVCVCVLWNSLFSYSRPCTRHFWDIFMYETFTLSRHKNLMENSVFFHLKHNTKFFPYSWITVPGKLNLRVGDHVISEARVVPLACLLSTLCTTAPSNSPPSTTPADLLVANMVAPSILPNTFTSRDGRLTLAVRVDRHSPVKPLPLGNFWRIRLKR